MLTESNITLFNSYLDAATREEKWKRSEVYNVHWEDSQGANIITSGLSSAASLNLYVPFYSAGQYVSPKQFANSQTGFTFKAGDKVVKGIVPDVTRIKELEQYDDVHTITTVDKKDFGSMHMRHFEIRGE